MVRSKTLLSTLAGAVALLLALLASPAGAQDYPPAGGPSVTVEPSTVVAGGDVTVTISGFAPADVTIAFNPTLGTITADANGAGSGTFTIPADTAPGDYTLTATQGDLVASTGLTVVAAAADGVAAPGALPRTGSDSSLPLAQTAIAAVAVGGLMVIAGNRRRQKVAA